MTLHIFDVVKEADFTGYPPPIIFFDNMKLILDAVLDSINKRKTKY